LLTNLNSVSYRPISFSYSLIEKTLCITVYCYTELAIFFPSGGRAIASTPFAYTWMDGQVELAWVVD